MLSVDRLNAMSNTIQPKHLLTWEGNSGVLRLILMAFSKIISHHGTALHGGLDGRIKLLAAIWKEAGHLRHDHQSKLEDDLEELWWLPEAKPREIGQPTYSTTTNELELKRATGLTPNMDRLRVTEDTAASPNGNSTSVARNTTEATSPTAAAAAAVSRAIEAAAHAPAAPGKRRGRPVGKENKKHGF